MFDQFGELPLLVKGVIAFFIVLGLILVAMQVLRRFASGGLGSAASRGRQPRLAVIDAAPVDGRRRLVLIRRDNVEHLIMIGGPTDLVVEPNIVRAAPAAAGRDTPAARPGGEPPARTVALPEGNMWPLQPEPVARPPRPAAPPAAAPEEPMWPPQPAEPALRASGGDRLAGLAADLSRITPVPAAPATEHVPQQPSRPAPADNRRPAPVAAPPMAASQPPSPSDEQNLAEMAHRLEAALRRPQQQPQQPPQPPQNLTESAPAPESAMMKPVSEPMVRPVPAAEPAPAPQPAPAPVPTPFGVRVAQGPDIARMTVDTKAPPKAARPESKPGGTKAVYDSLEQEMASLLGRQSGKT